MYKTSTNYAPKPRLNHINIQKISPLRHRQPMVNAQPE